MAMGAATERLHITAFVSPEFLLCPVFFKFVFIQAILKTNVWPSLKAGRLGPHLEPILYIGHKERQEGSRDRSKLTTTSIQGNCDSDFLSGKSPKALLHLFFWHILCKFCTSVSANILTMTIIILKTKYSSRNNVWRKM